MWVVRAPHTHKFNKISASHGILGIAGKLLTRLGATNARGVGREWRGNLRGGCMSKLCVE